MNQNLLQLTRNSYTVPYMDREDLESHLDKLSSLSAYPREKIDDLLYPKYLKELGFCYFVSVQNILAFHYHASVNWIYDDYPISIEYNITKQYRRGIYHGYQVYAGDIPDFALDKIKVVGDKVDFITIHSMSPLPIRMAKESISLERVDPILVGWKYNPNLHCINGVWDSKSNALGVVLAIWDNDKELEL